MTETRIRRRPTLFRRQLLVDKKIQYSMIVYSMIVALTTILFMAVFILVLQSAAQNLDDTPQSRLKYYALLAVMWASSMAVISFFGIYVTNKTAGPIYRLRKSMQSIADGGPVENVGFRKDDHFLELATDYNRVLERLRRAEGGRS